MTHLVEKVSDVPLTTALGLNGVVFAASLADIGDVLRICLLAASFALTCLCCYYKIKHNGKDRQ